MTDERSRQADRVEVLALADRVERASGPDRELDVRASLALSGAAYSESDVSDMLRYRDEPTGYGRYRPADEYVPAYTASLDAAMTLVPEGIGDELLSLMLHRTWEGRIKIKLLDTLGGQEWHANAATPALALTAAAFRARANQGDTNE